MNKWEELRDYIQQNGFPQEVHKILLNKMNELDEKDRWATNNHESDHESTEEELEAYRQFVEEQRVKHPLFYKFYDKVMEEKQK